MLKTGKYPADWLDFTFFHGLLEVSNDGQHTPISAKDRNCCGRTLDDARGRRTHPPANRHPEVVPSDRQGWPEERQGGRPACDVSEVDVESWIASAFEGGAA